MKHKLEFLTQITALYNKFSGDSADVSFEALSEAKAKKALELLKQVWITIERRSK